ncbi:MAG: UDP-glucose/GDP-mannose dehydrogenase family protein [Desulfobacteraceae bacterium]|nr:UDP-glucose/GDP-mannose dehydrogenase family protein [Desulfobacteraceae bacterium]
MKLSVIGLGKLGLCTAAYLASRGFKVAGYDINETLTDQLRNGFNPIEEPDLDELLITAKPNLTICNNLHEAVIDSDTTLIIVPTPSRDDGFFSNDYVKDVLCSVGTALSEKTSYHVVDVVSTVMPGSCEQEFIPMLETSARKSCGTDFGFVYNPEFIALGTVIKDFSRPDMVLIGASDERAAETVAKIYGQACLNSPPIYTMSLTNAEIGKLALNCFVTMKISFANELARICEKTPGADVDAVTSAIGQDTRIGNKYLTGGMGFGGPCFPRDNIALSAFANSIGHDPRLSPATQQVNQQVVDVLEEKIKANVSPGARITLLGMAYKSGSPIIEASQSMELANRLLERRYRLTVSDPTALVNVQRVLGERVCYEEDVYCACEGANAVVLLAPWPQYRRIDWAKADRQVSKGTLLLDCWRMAPESELNNFHCHALGKGSRK